eukprot:2190478-Prymnesium_polylepis.1
MHGPFSKWQTPLPNMADAPPSYGKPHLGYAVVVLAAGDDHPVGISVLARIIRAAGRDALDPLVLRLVDRQCGGHELPHTRGAQRTRRVRSRGCA